MQRDLLSYKMCPPKAITGYWSSILLTKFLLSKTFGWNCYLGVLRDSKSSTWLYTQRYFASITSRQCFVWANMQKKRKKKYQFPLQFCCFSHVTATRIIFCYILCIKWCKKINKKNFFFCHECQKQIFFCIVTTVHKRPMHLALVLTTAGEFSPLGSQI